MPRHQRVYPDDYRPRAREMRSQGLTYREIIEALDGDIPKNTISYWVSDIELEPEQRERIRQIELEARARGRPLAAEWRREQKRQRLQAAEQWATPIVQRARDDGDALLLMAAALWLGEGARRKDAVLEFANSDPRIITAWMELLRRSFDLDEAKFACQVHLSEGMPEDNLKAFWSQLTGIPLSRFHKSGIKKASQVGQVRRDGYNGVCIVTYYSAEIRRKLGALAWQMLDTLHDGA